MPWEIPITLEDTTYPVRFNTEAEPTQADIDEAVAYLMQQRSAPAAAPTDQPGRLGSFASSVGRGALSIIPGTIGGVGYLTGSDTLTEAADTVEGGINRMLPVNPEYQGEFKMKAGQAIGQALSMLGTGGVAGAAGKGLAISRGLEKAAAAAKGVKAAQNVMLGTGVLQGTRGGGQAAEQYGMQGGTAYARALLGGAIEGATERYLFGMGSELSPIGRMLGTGGTPAGAGLLRAVGTEAGEEAVAQVGGNLATTALAPYGIETPGAFAGAGEAALLGGIAGGVFGGVNALMQPSPTIEGEAMVPFEQAPAASETEAQDELGVAAFQQEIAQIAQEPDPIVPLQQTVNKAAETSVAANVELLPATAAVIAAGGLTPAPAVEEPATPAASTPEGEYFHGSSEDFDTFSTVRSLSTPQGRREEKVPITKAGRGQIYLTKDADYASTFGAKVKAFKPRSDLNLASFEALGHKDVTASDINNLLSEWGVNHVVKGDARPVFEWLKYGTLKQPLVSAGYDGFKLLESRSDSGRAVETIALFDNASIAERKGTPVGAPVVEQPASGVLLPETTPAPANFNEYELQQIEQANRDAALKALESNSQTAAITVDGNGVTLQMGDRQRHPTQNTSLTATVTDGELTADERKEAKRISQEGSLAETPEERAENKADQRALVRRVFERVYGTVAEQPVVEVPETLDQIRARLRQRISAEERATMEQNLAQMEDEGILADVFAEERQRAAQREDAARRQQDIENERQRFEDQGILGDVFAEERQRATAREQQRQQPPVVEETVAPEQPVPAVEETVAAQTDPATEEAPDRLMDVPQAMQFLYGKGLTKTDREKAQKLIEKNEREARKTGKVSGGRAFYESEIDAAVEEVLAQKQTSSDFRRTLEKARANKEASQELSTLVDALDVAEATLKEIESDRGMFGVQWAEKNVRRRATMQKAKIRDLKERIVALAPVKKSKTNAKPLLSRSERRAPEEPTKAEYEALLEEDRVNQLKAFKEERASLIDLYGNRGEKHPSGRQLGALNPAAQRLAYVRSRIFELEAKNPKEKAEKPEMTPVPGVNPKGKEGLLYNVKFGSRKGQIGKAGGKWYVVEDGDIVTENHPTAVAARDLWAKIGEAPPVKKSKTDAKPLLSRSERRALEEAEKAASTPETVPNVEITVDEPGAAEVGLGMEKLTSDFDTLFPLPAKQPRTLTAMRDRVITKMDELESTPDLPIYGSISSEEKDLNFKKNELRDAQLKKLNFILEKIEAEKLMQSKGHAPFARPAKRKPATPWSQDRPTVEEAKAYLTEKFGPEADSKYGDGWDSVRADVNNGIPRNRAIVNAAIEEKQLEADNKAADEKQAKEIAEQEPDSVLPSQPAYKPATTPSVAPKSPMMKQWEAIKTSVGDALVAVRLGDFYEFFYQDAEAAAPILNVALTKRNDLPMAGIPHHAAEKYFKQLVAAGRKVAVVDMSDLGKMKESLASRLRAATSRAEAESLLDSAKLDEVKAAALEMNYPAKGSKKDISRALISSVGSRVDAIAIRGAGITPVKPEPTVAPTPGAGTLSSGQRDTSKPEQMTPEESYAAYTTAKNLAPNLADMPKTQKQIQEGIAIAENSGIKDSELQRMLMDSAKAETGQFAGPYIKAQRIRLIEEAMEAQKSVSKAAVDAYKITLPEGYVQDGELYVYHPRLAYLKSREVDAYGGTALSDAEDAELAELQGQIAPEPAPPVQRDVTKPEQMTPEELYRDIANAQIATLESEIAAIKKSKNNPKSPWYGAKASETDKRQREIDQLKAPVMADWGIVIRALDAKLANREPVTEAWDELLKLLRLPGEFKARVEKAGYVRQGDLYVFQPNGTVEAEPAPPAKPGQRDVTKPEQMTPEEYSSSERDTELPKNYVLSDGNGNFVTEEKNGWFKVWRLTGTHATLAGTVGFKGVEGLTKAKTRLKEVSAEMHEEKLKDGLRTKRPVSTAAVDAYGITLPAGYIRQGDLYVFQPSGTVEAVTETVPPAKKTPESLLSALGGGWKLDGTTVSKDGFGHWTESQRDEIRAVFKKAGILTNTATPSGSGNRKSSFTIPSDDARRIQDEVFAEEVKLREAKKEQAKADEAAKQAEELSRVDPAAKQWMDSLFGRDDFANPANKVHLSDFVTGKTAKFGGMVNPRWLDGVQAADAVLEGGKVDFQKLKENFESSVAKPAPQPKPAAEVGTPINDPLGYGTALIALFPSLQKAGVTVISIEEAMTRLEAEWQKKKDSGKATRLDQIVYEANKRNTQSALDGENIGGIWTRTDKTVAVSNKATPSAMAHEVGHAIMELEYANAPEATKKAIEAEYTEWFKSKYGPEGVPTVADQRRIWEWMTDADWLNPATPFPQEQRVAKWEAYRSGFNEWFADEVAKWAVTRQQPRTLVDKFFSEIAAKLQKLWDSVKSNFSPNETLASWLDSISVVSEAKKAKPAAEVETGVAGVPAEVDAFFNPPPLSETVPLPRSEKIKIGPAAQQGFKARVKIAADEVSQIRSGYDGVGRLMEVALERGGVDEAIAFREWLLRQKDLSPEARRALLDFALPREQADWLKPKDFGSSNVVVTKETKDKAVKNLRKKIGGQTNVGLDPSILKDAIAIGAFYLEGGVRGFAEFSAAMLKDFGAGVQKYIRPAYEALRKRTDIDTSGMDPEEGGETAPKVEAPKTPPPPAPKAEAPKEEPKQETPKPAPAVAAEPATVPIANDPVDVQRVALGLPPIMRQTQEAYTFPQMWADAEAAMRANTERGKALVTELNDTPRTISALEDAILLRERVNRVNALDLAMVEFNKAPKGNNEVQRKAMDTAITSLTELDDALNVAGTEQGRSLNARKMLARLDYSLPKMLTTLRAANDGNLSEADVAMVTRLQKQIAEAQAKLAEVESGQAARLAEAEKVAFEAGRQEVIKDIEDRAKADAERLAEMQKRKTEYQAAKKEAATKPNKWAEIREAARARNAELRSNLYSDVVLVKAASMAVNDVIIGATYIAEGVTKLADWVTSMRGEGYNLSDKEMEQLFNESKAFDAGEELPAAETPLKTRKAKAPAIDKVKAIAADEESLDSRTVYELVVEKMKARAEASQGAKLPEMSEADLTSVIREVTADVQQYFPDITEREVRDLFSGYGKILQPSQDELSKQIRQLSALGKLASAIEDAKAKIAPLKSGPQRDKATQAIRLQQKKLARELRMSGLEYAAGEGQLRSPLDAIKARLNNQINDLALEINQRQKIKKRPSVDYDRETEALVTLRDDLKRISDEVNKPAGPTLEETVAEEMKKIDKRILELQKLIAENKFKPKEDTLLHTAELDAKRDVRDGLNKTLAKLRKEAADKLRTQDDIDKDAIESAQESIAELEKKIAAKDVSRPQRRTPTETAEYQALIEKKKSLQQVLSKLRESIEGKRQMSGEQRIKAATKALDASIARMTGMITSGKFDVIKRTPKTPDTPELKAKREARNNLRKRILELRKMKRDAGIDPIAKQISTDKKRIQTRMRKLKERMDKGDFSKPVKKTRATDEELLKLQIEEEELKEKWAKTVFERQLASRGPGKRLLDATQQTLNTSRAILTSVDVSAVLRQGGFIVLGNPMRGFRNLAPMFKAFASDEFAKGEKFRLANRENYKNGLYQQSKLFLADTSRIDQMSKQEEAFMTRWLEKIPRALGGGILRGSQRAYTVFLNRLRADSFDAMVGNLKKGAEPTPEETKAVADYINIATGRGDLGKFNQAGTMLNTVFFAPRLVASRFQILAGYPYFTASGRTKALVLREYAKFLAGAAVVYALGSLAQDDDDEPIETDPRSSDFLKIRFGDTRVDPLSGLIQATVLLSRLASGEKKQASGKIVPIRGADVPYGADDSFDVMGNFVRTKFSPIVGSAVNVVTGKNVVGEPTDVTEELKRMVIPMSLMEMKETLEAQGVPEATALIMLQLFGMGVQTYTPGKK